MAMQEQKEVAVEDCLTKRQSNIELFRIIALILIW